MARLRSNVRIAIAGHAAADLGRGRFRFVRSAGRRWLVAPEGRSGPPWCVKKPARTTLLKFGSGDGLLSLLAVILICGAILVLIVSVIAFQLLRWQQSAAHKDLAARWVEVEGTTEELLVTCVALLAELGIASRVRETKRGSKMRLGRFWPFTNPSVALPRLLLFSASLQRPNHIRRIDKSPAEQGGQYRRNLTPPFADVSGSPPRLLSALLLEGPEGPLKVFRFARFLESNSGAEGGGRTHTRSYPQRFLRPPRLPFRHFGVGK